MKKNYYFILSLFVTILNSCGTTNQLLQSVTKKQTEFNKTLTNKLKQNCPKLFN
jgi:hypothetical protein